MKSINSKHSLSLKTFIILMLLASPVFAENQTVQISDIEEPSNDAEIKTLFSLKRIKSHGGYMAFSCQYQDIENRDGLLIGGRLGWVINHSFTLGFGGYGFMNQPATDTYLTNYDTPEYGDALFSQSGGYGGLLFEPILFPRQPIHLAFPVLVGGGSISYARDYSWDNDYQDNIRDNNYDESQDSKEFFIINPGIELEVNLIKFVRLNAGAYYKYTTDTPLVYNTPDNKQIGSKNPLSGFSYGITLKIGYF